MVLIYNNYFSDAPISTDDSTVKLSIETLEELEEENKEYFMESGGENYHYIPCLNDHDDHIDVFVNLIKKHTQGWPL